MKRRLAVLLVLACTPAVATAARRLSVDDRPARIDSTYGSGHFGSWVVDAFGLPAFRYDVDQATDPRAQQPELAGATQAQHQVGNDQIVAAAFNDGYTQLWSQSRLSQWANLWQPQDRHWAGGFGWLKVGGTVLSTLYLDRPAGSAFERDFGVGYFRKVVRFADVTVEQVVYAPFGDDPVLLDDVTITNRSATPRTASWFEYWDVAPWDQPGKTSRGVGEPTWDPATRTLAVTQSGGKENDTAPLSIFAAALEGPLDGWETSLAAFFGDGTRAVPAAVSADRLSGMQAPASAAGSPSAALFAFRAPVRLAAGERITLRYVYGMAHPGEVAGLVARYRARPRALVRSARTWARWLPKADFGRDWRWVARELQWDAYLLRSATVWEEVCGQHTITQGGYYQYATGLNLGTRSWPHYLLPMVYAQPGIAQEILRYTIALQPQAGGLLPYGTGPLCTLIDFRSSSDLDFWVLLAAAEYGLGSRDSIFFDEMLPFRDTRQLATVWTHVKLAYRHQESLRGPHGGYLAGTNGDWSDFSATFLKMTESMLVTAQVAYVYPRLAELADRLGDGEFAATLRARTEELRAVLAHEWTGKGWYSRGYSNDTQIGAGAIFGEPQPWAILAGIPDAAQAQQLVANIRRFLDGEGAPHGPSRIGSSLTPAHDDPDVTEKSAVPTGVGDNNANYVGGVWFDVNGWLTWALGELDGVVPEARTLAWSEYTRNTLANHATQFPDHWAGTISIDDTCYAYYATHPERCGNDLYRSYDGQITEQATWMVMDAIRLAGITPTGAGFRIAPRLPFSRFSLRMPAVGVAATGHRLRGYVRPEQDGPLELAVALPRGVDPARVRTSVGARAVHHTDAGDGVLFSVPGRAGKATDWAVSW